MAKADDLKNLVTRLLAMKASAVAPAIEGAALHGLVEARLGNFSVWFFDSTLPPEATDPLPPIPCLGIEVREGARMNLLFRIHVEDGQMESGKLKANTWKRGEWEQTFTASVPA